MLTSGDRYVVVVVVDRRVRETKSRVPGISMCDYFWLTRSVNVQSRLTVVELRGNGDRERHFCADSVTGKRVFAIYPVRPIVETNVANDIIAWLKPFESAAGTEFESRADRDRVTESTS